MNNNLSRFADSKVYFQCPICTKSMDIQGNSLICRHGHCFDISRYGYVNLLLKSSPKTNYSKRSFDNRHQILEYGMYDVVLEKIIQFISDFPQTGTRLLCLLSTPYPHRKAVFVARSFDFGRKKRLQPPCAAISRFLIL